MSKEEALQETAEVQKEEGVDSPSMSKDQQRIAEWSSARDNAPSDEDVFKLREKMEKASTALDKATSDYETAAARRALVIGWTDVADEEGTTARQLHSWRRRYVPNEPDLTDVPKTIIPRERRRIESMEEQIKRRKQEEKEAQDRASRFRDLLKDWGEK